jgi:acyl-CoA thioester hydrolase
MTDEFLHPVDVRYLEVDAQGVVFNMWYLAYFDDALTAFLAHHGLAYRDLMAAGYDVQLVHLEVDWRGGVGWGDEVAVAVRLVRVGTTSFTLGYQVRRSGAAVVDASIVYVCVATDGSGKRPLPPLLLEGLGEVAQSSRSSAEPTYRA